MLLGGVPIFFSFSSTLSVIVIEVFWPPSAEEGMWWYVNYCAFVGPIFFFKYYCVRLLSLELCIHSCGATAFPMLDIQWYFILFLVFLDV